MLQKQTCILVLGMHRSGTSALTGVLNMLDVYLGSELMGATFANEQGYFENNHLFRLNEKLLSQIASSWDDTFYNESKVENMKETDELKETIQKEFEFANVFAIKDPRLIFLFPVYKKILEELNIEVKIILPYRNPIEVANSLNKRDDMSLEKGMLLWVYHFLLAEKQSREHQRVFVGFDELLDDTQSVINHISNKLDLKFITKYKKQKKQIAEFLEPSLKHHNISIDNLSHKTPSIVRNILALKDKFNSDNLDKEFDTLREDLFSYQKLFYNREIVNSLNEGQRAKEHLTQKEQELSQTKEHLTQKEKLINKQQEEIETLKDELVLFYEDSQCMLLKAVKKIKGLMK
ncbi:MAG: sulfotransferase domain-containing protein [Campylobacteraceae bacterium]|nr:sulfotransferase domain-containing protein [Campylobacteraceae bacterium]